MKKLIFLFLVLVACEKYEEMFCWQCHGITVTTYPGYLPDTVYYEDNRCMTQEQMLYYINTSQYETRYSNDGDTVIVEGLILNCGKKICQ